MGRCVLSPAQWDRADHAARLDAATRLVDAHEGEERRVLEWLLASAEWAHARFPPDRWPNAEIDEAHEAAWCEMVFDHNAEVREAEERAADAVERAMDEKAAGAAGVGTT